MEYANFFVFIYKTQIALKKIEEGKKAKKKQKEGMQ